MPVRDLEKRRRVMQRSMQLGHCICDPKKACPCDIFRRQDICPCAGEEYAAPAGPVRLTELVESAGCASKIDQATLQRILTGLPAPADPRVLVGMPAGDDAGVYLLDEQTALVQTVDVFSPSVDDPYTFGQIAAANSLSDVYAMGGRPLTALSVIGFPARKLPDEIMQQILRGGLDKMAEAGVAVIGGHSIKDDEIKAGFAVTGLIDPRRLKTNAAARPGDCLVLTKPLGTGIIAFAAQIGRADAESVAASARSMTALNKTAAELMVEFDAHACTDVTGFGLMGHLKSMAVASKADVEIAWDDVPLLPGVLQCAAEGIFSGAVERNKESSGDALAAVEGVEPAAVEILFDAQTSGGLLIALPEPAAEGFIKRLHAEGIREAAVIGRVSAEGTGRILLRSQGRRRLPTVKVGRSSSVVGREPKGDSPIFPAEKSGQSPGPPPTLSCCGGDDHAQGNVDSAKEKFLAFLGATNASGALDGKTKRAMAIALSVLAKCEPCVKLHVRKAREEGFTPEEIDEAAWMGIAFGGSPVMMFYNEAMRK
ncbi:MAG: selenide, water dikinase SelD [Pirellulales bacterium]|nr:selenide, water dikinase SelD [Pirellulales bacterium]